jgi:hypothetical protein
MTDPVTPLRITLEDLAEAAKPAEQALAPVAGETPSLEPGKKSYGNINTMPDEPALDAGKASILLQAWFYLGLAGLVGALAGWAIAEPGFVDGPEQVRRWGNVLMTPLLVALMCVGFAVAESIVERSVRKVLIRGGLALPLGMVLGFVFSNLANIFYSLALFICFQSGIQSFHNPGTWIARGLAWMVLGAAGGVVYGIIGQSMKQTGYGVLGGAVGAAVGGFIFDPISFATNAGGASRAVGFGLLGLATGIAIGLVESALKDRWLYVTSGPLAGKQFILYKPQTSIGSAQTCDIYLFKDPAILPQHGMLAIKAAKVYLIAQGAAFVGGQPVRGSRLLESGSVIQVGRYSFRYQERQRS